MSNFNNRLILYPKDINQTIVTDAIVNKLIALQFMHNTWEYQQRQYYLAGNDFSNLMIFLGCAPHINFVPDNDDTPGSNFVAIHMNNECNNNILYPGKIPFKYRCPNCKFNHILTDNFNQSILKMGWVKCANCESSYDLQQINWHHKAGVGHFFIEVMGIYESEAVPSDKLMKSLKEFSNCEWNYFFANQGNFPAKVIFSLTPPS